jgi:flagellar basal body-associated protein FliL
MAQSKKKKMMLIGALVLAGGGGFFGYQTMVSAKTEEVEVVVEAVAEPVFLTLAALQAPVVEGRRIDRYVTLGVTLELADEAAEELAKERMAPLRDVLVNDLLFQAHMSRTRGFAVHLPRVKARFLILSRRVLGEDAVKDVLIVHAFDPGF